MTNSVNSFFFSCSIRIVCALHTSFYTFYFYYLLNHFNWTHWKCIKFFSIFALVASLLAHSIQCGMVGVRVSHAKLVWYSWLEIVLLSESERTMLFANEIGLAIPNESEKSCKISNFGRSTMFANDLAPSNHSIINFTTWCNS